MKILGLVVLTLGVCVFIFSLLGFFQKSPENLSPIMEDDGVRVIYLSPTK